MSVNRFIYLWSSHNLELLNISTNSQEFLVLLHRTPSFVFLLCFVFLTLASKGKKWHKLSPVREEHVCLDGRGVGIKNSGTQLMDCFQWWCFIPPRRCQYPLPFAFLQPQKNASSAQGWHSAVLSYTYHVSRLSFLVYPPVQWASELWPLSCTGV